MSRRSPPDCEITAQLRGMLVAMESRMRAGSLFLSTFVILAPLFVAAACAGDGDAAARGSGGSAGASTGGSAPGAGGKAGSAGGVAEHAGGADACVLAGGDTNGVIEPLDDACDEFDCPASIADAAKKTLRSCTNLFPPRITYGCGKVTVDYSDFSGGTSYTFDSATNEVVQIRTDSDTPSGACHANVYFYGGLGESCPGAITCYPCADLRNDAQAGAGAAGAAGETGSVGDAGAAGLAGAGGAGFVTPPHCPNFSEL